MGNKKNLTIDEANKRFQQILEYITFNNNVLHEEGDDNNQVDNVEPNNTDVQDDANDVDIQNNVNGAEPNNNLGDVEQGNMVEPNVNNVNDDMGAEEGDFTEDEDVIDITQLTDSQEEIEKHVDLLDDKFNKVIKLLNNFETMIKSNDDKIDELKREIEKRNPTPKEKLELMSTKSDIFNVKPKDFWEDKERNGNYEIVDSDDDKEKYTITKGDLNTASDWKTISDSMSGYDIMNQTMRNTMPNF